MNNSKLETNNYIVMTTYVEYIHNSYEEYIFTQLIWNINSVSSVAYYQNKILI